MTQVELEAFEAVVKYGSISAAAENIFVSQSAISRRIQTLERQLGYDLFDRNRGFRAVKLTEQGKLFVPICAKMREIYKEAAEVPQHMGLENLRIGAIGSLAAFVLPDILKKFSKEYPNLRLEISGISSVEGYRFLENGALDYALVSDLLPTSALQVRPLWQERYVLAFAKEVLPEGTVVSVYELDGTKEILVPWSPEFEVWRAKQITLTQPKVKLNHMGLLASFMHGNAYVIAPISVAKHMKCKGIYEIKDGPPDRMIYGLSAMKAPSVGLEAFQNLLASRVL